MNQSNISRLATFLFAGLVVTLAGCTTQTVKRVNVEPAEHAEREIPASQLLNVNISVFDPNVPEDLEAQEEQNIYPGVRDTEARYMPYNLRRTLQDTGHWGAVRVVPEPIETSELLVTGKVLHSDGELLKLKVQAKDATGRVWLDKVYDQKTARLSYTPEAQATQNDPFQGIYNQISNDLLEARRDISTQEVENIRQVSEVRFAADLAPESFAPYLSVEGDRYKLKGLPAANDPNVQRIAQIRERDYALIDALDQHYGLFYQQVDPAYDEWRSSSYREVVQLRELRQQALSRKLLGAAAVIAGVVGSVQGSGTSAAVASQAGIIGGAVLFGSGLQKGRESELHAEALKELGQSLESDVKPRVVELEGQTVTLSGSAEAQYEEWRRLLRQIYAAETGFHVSSESSAGSGAARPGQPEQQPEDL